MVIETGSDLRCLECRDHFAFSYYNQIDIRRANISKQFGLSFTNYPDDYFIADYELHCPNCQKVFDEKIDSLTKRITELLASNSGLNASLHNLYIIWSSEGNGVKADKYKFIFTYIEQLHSDASEIASETQIMMLQFRENTVINDSNNMPYKFFFEDVVFKTISCLKKVHIVYSFLYNVDFRTRVNENTVDYLWKKLKKVDDFKYTEFYLGNHRLIERGVYRNIDERRKRFDHGRTYGSHNTFSEVLDLALNVIEYCELIYKLIPELEQLSIRKSNDISIVPEYQLMSFNVSTLTESDMPDFSIVQNIYQKINLLVNRIYKEITIEMNLKVFDDYDISCRFSEISHSLWVAETLINMYHATKQNVGVKRYSDVDYHSLTNSAIKRLSSVQDKIARLICLRWSIAVNDRNNLYFSHLVDIFSQYSPQDESQRMIMGKITKLVNSEDFRIMRNYRDRLFHIRDDLKSYSQKERFYINLSLIKQCISVLSDLIDIFYDIKLV